VQRYAIALGCEVRHADKIVYADNMGVSTDSAYEPIGISCRICERQQCHQRSVPPLERRLTINTDKRGVLPYEVS
jgi:predicted transcriptional regulator